MTTKPSGQFSFVEALLPQGLGRSGRLDRLSSLVKWGHTRRYNEGILHFNRGEFERAAECFEAVLEEVRDPNDPDHCLALVHAAEARANLGLAYQHAGLAAFPVGRSPGRQMASKRRWGIVLRSLFILANVQWVDADPRPAGEEDAAQAPTQAS